MSLFFTADQHFRHKNVIKYCNRPFKSVEEMDETMINNWNQVVRPCDTTYLIGDVAFVNHIDNALKYLFKLNGRINLILGNHDRVFRRAKKKGKTIFGNKIFIMDDIVDLKLSKGISVILCHYPMYSWNRQCHGSWHFYGHVHEKVLNYHERAINVGVDAQNFTPVNGLKLIQEKMENQDG